MDDPTRDVAWAIAEAWWRKTHRRAAGTAPEATSSEDYADNFWQGFCEEAAAAMAVLEAKLGSQSSSARIASDRFA